MSQPPPPPPPPPTTVYVVGIHDRPETLTVCHDVTRVQQLVAQHADYRFVRCKDEQHARRVQARGWPLKRKPAAVAASANPEEALKRARIEVDAEVDDESPEVACRQRLLQGMALYSHPSLLQSPAHQHFVIHVDDRARAVCVDLKLLTFDAVACRSHVDEHSPPEVVWFTCLQHGLCEMLQSVCKNHDTQQQQQQQQGRRGVNMTLHITLSEQTRATFDKVSLELHRWTRAMAVAEADETTPAAPRALSPAYIRRLRLEAACPSLRLQFHWVPDDHALMACGQLFLLKSTTA